MASNKKPSAAANWLQYAIQDYAAARCALMNGLLSGFILGQQALEKLLKAYLTIAHPDHVGPFIGDTKKSLAEQVLDDVNPGHDLVAHLKLAEQSFPALALNPTQLEFITNLSYCFQGKYPDIETPLKSRTTAWYQELDRIFINWSLEIPLPDNQLWRSGVYECVWQDVIGDDVNHPYILWIRKHNPAFAEVFTRLCAVVASGSSADKMQDRLN